MLDPIKFEIDFVHCVTNLLIDKGIISMDEILAKIDELRRAIKSKIEFAKRVRREFPVDFEILKSLEGKEIDL